MNRTRLGLTSALATLLLVTGACNDKRQSYGDPNSVIAVTSPERWDEIDDAVYAAFETTITTVRDEKKFTVTYQEPFADHWQNLRRFQQMLVIGSRGDRVVDEVIDRARDDVTGDGVHQVGDIWAIGQNVSLILLPEGWTTADLEPYLTEVSGTGAAHHGRSHEPGC